MCQRTSAPLSQLFPRTERDLHLNKASALPFEFTRGNIQARHNSLEASEVEHHLTCRVVVAFVFTWTDVECLGQISICSSDWLTAPGWHHGFCTILARFWLIYKGSISYRWRTACL